MTMQHLPEDHGFGSRNSGDTGAKNGRAMAGLLTACALAAATIVAATVVTIGFARASGLTAVVENESGVFMIALLLGALFVASCVSKAVSPRRTEKRDAIRSGFGREHLPYR